MNRRDELRRVLMLAAQSMSSTISSVRELGHHDLAAELEEEVVRFTRVGNRGVRRVSLHGREVVPPIVSLSKFGPSRPPIGVTEWQRYVPMLRAQYAPRPPVRLMPVRTTCDDSEVLDAG